MNRFGDIDPSFERLSAVYAHRSEKVVPIEKALEPINPHIDELPYYIRIAKKYCHFPSEHGLSKDQSAALYIYAMEWGDTTLNRLLNKALRLENRQALKIWYPYLKLFDTALDKLPTVKGVVWRGVSLDISKNFSINQLLTWWSISSCSSSANIIKHFLGNDKNSTLFLIEALNGIKVSGYTEHKNEDEIILRMGTQFCVKGIRLEQSNGLHIVYLIEVDDNDDESSTFPIIASNKGASDYPVRNPNTFAQTPHFPQQFYNPQMPKTFQQPTIPFPRTSLQHLPFLQQNDPRGMNPYFRTIRPLIEPSNPTQTYMPQIPYHAYPQTHTISPIQQYPRYVVPHTYSQPISSAQVFNQSQSPPQYSGSHSQQQTRSPHISNQSQSPPQYFGSHSQQQMRLPEIYQQSSFDQQDGPSFQSLHSRDTRERKSISLVDLMLHTALELKTSTPLANVSSTTTEDSITKQDQSDSPKRIEIELIESKSTSNEITNEIDNQLVSTESSENVTSTKSNDTAAQLITIEKPPSLSKRLSYTMDELRSKRFDPIAQKRPATLKEIRGITMPEQNLNEYRRDVTTILDKLTPQMYGVLLKQLHALELNSFERLETMISIILIKAVDRAEFSSLYATLCKHFQNRHVIQHNKNGQRVTFVFVDILLTHCQKEFQNDYRQEIEYEKRMTEVETITDNKTRKEAAEQLEEDLVKAKRKKIRYIIFFGELFKLQILTDTSMYDCINYLLQNKIDEENLQCLCKLLTIVGKELDTKTKEKSINPKFLEYTYAQLNNIINQPQTSARIRSKIQDLMDMRKANWVACRTVTTDEIQEEERIEGDSRRSSVKQQSNRIDEDRNDNRVIIDSLRQIKQNHGATPLSFVPQRASGKGSGMEKNSEDNRSTISRTSKSPAGHNHQLRLKTSSNNISITDSREGSRNVSRERSLNASSESSASKLSVTEINTSFDEEKIQACVRSLIEKYTENDSDNNDRLVNKAIEDLSSFSTINIDQEAIIVRELFTNVLKATLRACIAVGHLFDVALQKNIISTEGFLSGIKLFLEVVPNYAVDIPLIWQYTSEVIGTFIGASLSNMILLKPILQSIPDTKVNQLFEDIIRYAIEFSSKAAIQKSWQSAGFTLSDLIKYDSSFLNEYNWLNEPIEFESTSMKENRSPHADPQLIKLFKSINDQGTTIPDEQILSYIHENMNSEEKFYIRNIVLSYLEACLIDHHDLPKQIHKNIAKKRISVLHTIIEHKPEKELQAVYAIQNFVSKLEHPPKMARVLFDIFYDQECVNEETFFEWLKHPDPSETEGHAVVELSTKDFFFWLQQQDDEEEES